MGANMAIVHPINFDYQIKLHRNEQYFMRFVALKIFFDSIL